MERLSWMGEVGVGWWWEGAGILKAHPPEALACREGNTKLREQWGEGQVTPAKPVSQPAGQPASWAFTEQAVHPLSKATTTQDRLLSAWKLAVCTWSEKKVQKSPWYMFEIMIISLDITKYQASSQLNFYIEDTHHKFLSFQLIALVNNWCY